MKELTIEEKAKAYDEAIERAKAWYDCKHATTDDKILLKRILPELAESEDERIRKDMMETIEKESKDFPSSVIAEKSHIWLAWLEKQGDKDKFIEKELQCIKGYRENAIKRLEALKKARDDYWHYINYELNKEGGKDE